MIKISCEGETPMDVLSHLKGFASLLSADVSAKTSSLPEEIIKQTSAPAPREAASVNPAAVPSTILPAANSAPTAAPSATIVTPENHTPAAVPTAAPPAYTLDQIAKAGADLVASKPGVMPQLQELFKQYGVQTVMQLKPEQLGSVATTLRGMGAKI